MKTQNNIQKTISCKISNSVLRGVVIIFSVALISLTVSAQDFWQQFDSKSAYEKMASMISGQPSEDKNADAAIAAINAEVASKLNHSAATFNIETEKENELKIENWMIDGSNFTSHADFTSEEKEPALEIEDWMLDIKNFGKKTGQTEPTENEPMPIEPWMTNNLTGVI